MSVLVSFKERSKIIKLNVVESQSESEYEWLMGEVKKSFNLEAHDDVLLQKFDEDWTEYIDLDDSSVLSNKDRLRVVALVVQQCSESPIPSKVLDTPVS